MDNTIHHNSHHAGMRNATEVEASLQLRAGCSLGSAPGAVSQASVIILSRGRGSHFQAEPSRHCGLMK